MSNRNSRSSIESVNEWVFRQMKKDQLDKWIEESLEELKLENEMQKNKI